MINLLPPREKAMLLMEKKKRMVVILWLLLLFFLICLILILFSVKFYLQGQLESQRILLLEAGKEFGQAEIQELQEEINILNLTLTKLESFYQEKIYFSGIIGKISQTLPGDIYLNNLSIIFPSVSLSGFAPTRESLLQFKRNLDQEKDFKEVYFPAANWVKSTDIDFHVTFQLK